MMEMTDARGKSEIHTPACESQSKKLDKHFRATPRLRQIECTRGIRRVFNHMTFIKSNFQQETLSQSSPSSMHNTASANGLHNVFLCSFL